MFENLRLSIAGRAVAVARAATTERYRLGRRFGVLHFAAAILDPFFYATIVHTIQAAVFGNVGAGRFHLILLGFITFRWTLVAALHAHDLGFLRRRLNEHADRGLLFGLISVTAPATAAFLISLLLAFAMSIAADAPGRSLAAIASLPVVIAIQGAWTIVLVLALDSLERLRVTIKDTTIIGVAAAIWFFTPVMYQFGDVPVVGGLSFINYNPVAYIVAAYHNAYWFGRLPTLTTLAAAAALAASAMWAYQKLGIGRAALDRNLPYRAPSANLPHLIVRMADAPAMSIVAASGQTAIPIVARWPGRLIDITGSGLVRIVLAARGAQPSDDGEGRISTTAGIGELYLDNVAIYPDAARDQLAFALAAECHAGAVALDGLLDNVQPSFLHGAWRL
ncbi:MAG: hypothetical protein ACKVSF_04130, partial [Alphaproteobacteria bacterium]